MRALLAAAPLLLLASCSVGDLAPLAPSSSAPAGPLPPIPDGVRFEQNLGQFDADALFKVHANGPSAFITRQALVMVHDRHAVFLRFEGAQADPEVVPEARQAGVSNHFLGNDPARWVVDAPHFGRVVLRGLYPGIDLVYHGTDRGELKYDFVVAAGASPAAIRLRFDGPDGVSVTDDGGLRLVTPTGTLRQGPPVTYQDGGRTAVDAAYVVSGTTITLALGAYDPSKPLVVDPPVYSTYLGGWDWDAGKDIDLDAAGNIYVFGHTNSLNFPTTPGAYDGTGTRDRNLFVTKLDPSGASLVYSTYLGGAHDDAAKTLVVDAVGNAYLHALTGSLDFPTTPGAFQTGSGGALDAAVVKVAPSGAALVYSTYLGGSSWESGWHEPPGPGDLPGNQPGLAVDAAGHAYVSGFTASADFPATVGAHQPALLGPTDVFLAKFDPMGTGLVYATFLGGSGEDRGNGLAVDAAGNAYLTGETFSLDFPTTPGVFQTVKRSGVLGSAFVTKIDALGGLSFSTFLGGPLGGRGSQIAVDAAGDVFVTGSTTDPGFPTTANAHRPVGAAGYSDAFVARLDGSGASLVYSTLFGGLASNEHGLGLGVDAAGNAHLVGTTDGNGAGGIPVTATAIQSMSSGGGDAFIAAFDPTGSTLSYATYLGGTAYDVGWGIALHGGGIYVTGLSFSTAFPTTPGAYDRTWNGQSDAFVTKI